MAKVSKRIENSYQSYLRYRESWADKGYGLDRQLTLQEYNSVHKQASHAGWKHIARDLASEDRTFRRSEGAAIVRRIKNATHYEDIDKEALRELQRKYKRGKDIYGLQLSPEEAETMEERRRSQLAERGKTPQYTIQANARAKLFNELRDAGLSYQKAEEILYG